MIGMAASKSFGAPNRCHQKRFGAPNGFAAVIPPTKIISHVLCEYQTLNGGLAVIPQLESVSHVLGEALNIKYCLVIASLPAV